MQHHLGLKSNISPKALHQVQDQIIQDSSLYPQIARCRGTRCQLRKTKFRPKIRPKIRSKIRRPKPKIRPKMVPKAVPKMVPKIVPKMVTKSQPKLVSKKVPLTTVKPTERQNLNQIGR